MRRVSIFGSTGSIGCNTVDLLKRQGGTKAYDVIALTGGANIDLLARQAQDLNAEIAITAFDEFLPQLRLALHGTGIEVAAGSNAIAEAAGRKTDWTMSAIVGSAGLRPGLETLKHGGILALANKESLVTAGPLMLAEAKKYGAVILPVDSEHSAIFQAINGEAKKDIDRIILTASGGPFLKWTTQQLSQATPEQAVAHPNWSMGKRISIDSASLFNKAMEVVETKEFFQVNQSVIEVIIHPQSIVHSMVGFTDGALLAHLGPHDMRGPIGYALNWPTRQSLPLERLDFAKLGRLDFEAPDEQRFPALRIAQEVMSMGGLSGAAFNAAKEIALDGFLAGRIGFNQMAQTVELVLEELSARDDLRIDIFTLERVLAMDKMARIKANDVMNLRLVS